MEEREKDVVVDGRTEDRFDAASAYKREVKGGLVKLTEEGNEAGEGGGVAAVGTRVGEDV